MTRVFFATNRCPNSHARPTEFADHACGDDPQNIRFGTAEVNLKTGTVRFKVAPEKHVGDPDRQVLGSAAIFDQCRQALIDDPADCLFFIHGFANTFRGALLRAAQLREFYLGSGAGEFSKRLHLFAFCWPSDGKVVGLPNAYRSDRIDAALSGPAIGRTILKALDFVGRVPADRQCRRRVHLLAHSMGNWALRHALQHIQEESPRGPTVIFDQAILAAADEDADAFESAMKLRYLATLSRRITAYLNFQDAILHVSDWTKGNPDRLGKSGPANPERVPNNVTVVNCSKVITDKGDVDLTTHQYYRNDETVRRDIVSVLRGRADDIIANRLWVPEKRYYTLQQPVAQPRVASRRSTPSRRNRNH